MYVPRTTVPVELVHVWTKHMFTNKLLCRYIDYKFYKYLRIFTLDFTLSFEIYEKPYLVPGSGYPDENP